MQEGNSLQFRCRTGSLQHLFKPRIPRTRLLLFPFARGEARKAGLRVCELLTSLTELAWMLDEDNTKFNLGITFKEI